LRRETKDAVRSLEDVQINGLTKGLSDASTGQSTDELAAGVARHELVELRLDVLPRELSGLPA